MNTQQQKMKQHAGEIAKLGVISLFLLCCGMNAAWAQTSTTDHFRSKANGNWNATATWESSPDGIAWINATLTPTNTANTITIRSGHTVTVTANVSTDQTTVDAGGNLTVNNVTLTVADGAGTDLTVNGTLVLTGASGVITTTGTVAINNNAVYQHSRDGGTIPTAAWNSGSTCLITGMTGTQPGGRDQAFFNLTLNNTGQTGNITFTPPAFSVAGTMTVQSTGTTGQVRWSNNTTASIANYTQSGGYNRMANGNNAFTMNISGSFTLSGGTLSISEGGGTGNGTINVAGNFSHTAGTISETNTSTGIGAVVFNGSATQTYTSGGVLSGTINFTVNSGATLKMGTGASPSVISSGSDGSFILSSGAALVITSPAGITTSGATGNIQLTGARNYNAGANYTYNGAAAQVTGNGLVTANNLTIDNSAGVSLSGNTAVNGTLTLTSGNLNIGSFNLTLGNNAVAGGPFSDSKMIIASGSGSVVRSFSSSGNYLFPIGDNTGTTEYSPITLNFTSGSSTVSARVTDAIHPATASANHITRYWTITGSGSFQCDVSATYVDNDVVGNEAEILMVKYNGSFQPFSLTDAPNNTLTASGVTGFSDFTGQSAPGSLSSDLIADGAYSYLSNIDYSLYQSASSLTTGTSAGVMGLIIRDGGAAGNDADALATTLTSITFSTGGSTAIRTAALFDGTTNVAEVAVNGATSFTFSSLSLSAADDATKNFELRVTYQSEVTDNQQIQFTAISAAADFSGSGFASPFVQPASSVAGDINRLIVTADRLAFVQQPPSLVAAYAGITVTVEATDALGSRDLDYITNISLSSSGTMTGDPLSATPVAGFATFNSLVHTAAGTGLTLTAASGILTPAISSAFDVVFISFASDYFRSKTSGNWNATTTWESSPDNVNFFDATLTPTNTANTITIRSGHTVTVTANVSTDQTTVDAGGNLTVNNVTLTVADGAGTDLTVNGTLVLTGASGVITTTGTVAINNNAVYQHSRDGGTIPTAAWNSGSTCLITGMTGTQPGGRDQAFFNLTLNNTGQTGNITFTPPAFSVAGTMTVQSTGTTGQVRWSNNTTASIANYTQSGGYNRMANGNNAFTMNISGSFTLSGGTLSISEGGGTGNGTINVAGNFSHTAGTISETNTSTGIGAVVFNGSATQTYTSGGVLSGTINFTVNSGATLKMGTGASPSVISSGSDGSFILSSGAALVITSPAGITTSGATGNIQLTGARNYNAGANYTYNGAAAQVTGNGLVTANNLTIDNSAGVSLSGNTAVNGTLTLTSGNLNIGSFNLTLGNNAVAGGPFSDSKMIIASGSGSVVRSFSSSGNYLFPIGDNTGTTEYSPITLNFTSGSATVSVKVTDATHPNNGSADYITRYWTVSGAGTFSCNITANYVDADVVGSDENQMVMGRWNGSSWQLYDAVDALNNTLTATGVTSLSDFTGLSVQSVSVSASPNDTVCQNTPLTLTASGSGTFQWSHGLGTSGTAHPSTALPGTTTYSVTLTDGSGITSSASIDITVLETPSCNISGNDSICPEGQTEFTASGGASYSWSGPGGFTANTASTGTLSAANAGTYTVTVTSANGCTSSCSIELGVYDSPVCNITGSQQICVGGFTEFTASGGVSYSWTGPGGFTASTAGTGPINTAGEYSVTVTDANGCTSSCSRTLTVGGASCSVTGDNEICAYETTEFSVGQAEGYSWSGPGGFTATTQTTGSINAAGTYSVTVTFPGGCTSECSRELTVHVPVACDITGDDVICIYETTEFTAAAGGASYSWSGPGGFSHSGQSTGSISQAGVYSVTITDAFGCTSACSRTLTVHPAPSCAITGDNSLCPDETSTEFTASGGTSYSWSGPGGFSSNTSTTGTLTHADVGTYTVTVTDDNGCTSSCSVTLTSVPFPSCSITGGSELICPGEPNLWTAAGGVSYSWSGPGGFTSTSNPINAQNAGTYHVTVTDANGCTSTCSRTLALKDAPVCGISGGADAICSGQSTTWMGTGGIDYEWAGPNGFSSGNSSIEISDAGTYHLTVTGLNFCTSSCSRTLTVNSPLLCSITGGVTTLCAGQSTTWNATSGGASYSWSGPGGFTFSSASPSVNITATTSGTYNVTITTADGCESACGRVLNVNQNPSCIITGTNVICQGQTTSFTVGAIGGATYSWSGPGGFTSSAQTISNLSVAGTYSVTITVTATGCTSTCSRDLTVNPIITCSITGGVTTLCSGQTTTWSAAAGGQSYSWSGPGGFTATTQDITIGTAGTYNVTITAPNGGCTTTCSRTLTVNPTPNCTITGTFTICQGQTTQFSAFNNGGGHTYSWSGPGGFTSTSRTPSGLSVAGIYSVTATNTTTGCTCTNSQELTVNPIVACSITGTQVICSGQTSTFTAAAGGAAYSWSGPAGGIIGSNTGQSVTVGTTGTYNVTITASPGGCTTTCSRTLTVNAPVTCSISGTQTICAGQSTTFTATGGGTYSWSGPNGFTASTAAITFSNAATSMSGTYTVTVSVVANGITCTNTCSRELTVNPNPSCNITGPSIICPGQLTTYTATGGGTYSWSGPGGFTSTSNAIIIGTAGTYTVTVTNSFGCTTSCSKTLTVNPTPIITVLGDSPICEGQSSTFTATGALFYSWVGPPGFTATTQNPIVVTIPGVYLVTGFDANFCQAFSGKALVVNPLPSCKITGPEFICQGSTATLTGFGGTSYSWSGPGGFSSTSNPIEVSAAGTYHVTVTDANGCSSSCSHNLGVNPLPVCSITGDSSICAGETATFTAHGGTSYSWAGPSGFSSTDQVINVSDAGTYSLTCTDANGCSSTCCSIELVFTESCDDDNACTDDSCLEGDCINTPISCDDSDACTDDSCHPLDGCQHNAHNCDDGNACTGDACDASAGCQYTPADCDDDNACTVDLCDNLTGCYTEPLNCDDGSACTTDGCAPASGCTYNTVNCDDDDACTDDSCDGNAGCQYATHDCDDDNACTDDSCDGEAGCQYAAHDCDDHSECTIDGCDAASGCAYDPVDCDDSNECTDDLCNPASGCYTETTDCDDNVACTADDCDTQEGCINEPIANCCVTDEHCNDGNACTDNVCDAGFCLITPVSCDDGNACTDDSCVPATGCQYAAHDCDDDDACTDDSCNEVSGCQYAAVDCDDDDACTDDSCDRDTGCLYAAHDCDDDDACTDDSCDRDTGCLYAAHDCDDDDACTDDSCDRDTGCLYAAHDCDDDDACTDDSCDRDTGCLYAAHDCDDNDECTDDSCDKDLGCQYAVHNCDDDDACTDDSCDKDLGCQYAVRNCDDDDACTDDSCDKDLGCQYAAHNCDDNDACTDDSCDGDAGCLYAAHDCDDHSECTIDGCDAASGCFYDPVDCNDGNACTNDSCNPAEGCQHAARNCDDNNACTNDSCNPAEGCVYAAVNCDDGNACTDDTCSPPDGCQYAIHNCDDGNACTDDHCDSGTGCYYTATDCDDHVFCTDDGCLSDSGCFHNSIANCCVTDEDCNDSDLCTDQRCDLSGFCQYSAHDCNDGHACTQDGCSPTTGCTHAAITCNDLDPCTFDTCNPATGCTFPMNTCNDNNECTFDFCFAGQCFNVASAMNGSPCADDGNACTDDICQNGTCTHTTRSCNDGDPCTIDACINGNCQNTPKNCDDNIFCTLDYCLGGTCVNSGTALNGTACASDGNLCTDDFCQNGSCTHPPKNCNDGNPCTTDGCDTGSGQCTNTPVNCNDNNVCTTDGCNVNTGLCVNTPIAGCCTTNAQCNDNNACTSDACTNNACVNTPVANCCTSAAQCNDNNACTADACTNNLCVNTPIAGCGGCTSNAQCNDNNVCTSDVCTAGVCANNPIANCCTSAAQCNDNNACTTDACTNNTCKFTAITCKDNNACTADACNPATGCTFTAIPNCCTGNAQCNDNNPCTSDKCTNNVCVNTPKANCCTTAAQCNDNNACTTDACTNNKCTFTTITCNDNNACTSDACNTSTGCVFTPIANCCTTATQCNDNNVCTSDACNNNQCVNTAIANCCTTNSQCNDNNVCTSDACSNNQCVNTPIANCCTSSTQCNDNNVCTTNTCTNNQCVFAPIANCCTTATQCNDNNVCTADACNNNQCVNTPIANCCISSTQCNDNNVCTTNTCTNNQCVFAPIANCCTTATQCNDNNVCTADACNNNQCVNTPIANCCISSTQCNDNNVCTTNTCTNNQCVFAPIANCCTTATQCNDNNVCTADACNNNQCVNTPIANCCTSNAQCNDNNICTIDACSNNLCTHTTAVGVVVSFTLVNSSTDQDIGPLVNGQVVNLALTPNINVRANLCTDAGTASVKFNLNGSQFKIENTAPWALAGDNPTGDYHKWNVTPGTYTIQAIPYTGSNATGTAGTSLSVTITVINGAAKTSSGTPNEEHAMLSAHPNPFEEKVTISFSLTKTERARVEILSVEGRLIATLFDGIMNENENYHADFRSGNLAGGIYFYRIVTESGAIENRKMLLLR